MQLRCSTRSTRIHPPRRCPQKDPSQKQEGTSEEETQVGRHDEGKGRERYQRSSTMATSHSFRFAASLLAPEASPKVVIAAAAAAANAFWSRLNAAQVSTGICHPLFFEDPPPFGSFSTQMLQRCHLYYLRTLLEESIQRTFLPYLSKAELWGVVLVGLVQSAVKEIHRPGGYYIKLF